MVILKFRLNDDYFDNNGLKGPNMFSKELPPYTGYSNRKFAGQYPGVEVTQITDTLFEELLKRRRVEILDYYDIEQRELSTEGDTEVSSAE